MDPILVNATFMSLACFFGIVWGLLYRNVPSVKLDLEVANGKLVTFDDLRKHHQRPGLDMALVSLLRRELIGWKFTRQDSTQHHSGLPPLHRLAECSFWRKRDGGLRLMHAALQP
jgi:hypothetical protein